MDRQAFRNRMQQLKQYREQNPGKTYLDFKDERTDHPAQQRIDLDHNIDIAQYTDLINHTDKNGEYNPFYLASDDTYGTVELPTVQITAPLTDQARRNIEARRGASYVDEGIGTFENIKYFADGGEIGDEEKQFLINWYNKRRQYANIKAPYMNKQIDVLQKGFTTPPAYNNDNPTSIMHKGLDQIPIVIDDKRVKSIDKNAKAYYHPNEGIVLSRDWKDKDRENLLHEMTHRLNQYGQGTSKHIQSIINGQKVYDKGKYTEYLTRPEEIYSRLMEFRKLNNLNPLKTYGRPDIEKLRKEGKDTDILNLFPEDDVILDLLNTTAYVKNDNITRVAQGGEIPPSNKPIIPEEPQPYKGKLYKDRYGRKYTESQLDDYYDNSTDEIDRFTGKPFIRGLKPVGDIEDAANATPVGDAISVYDTYKALRNKDWGNAGLAALGLVPFVPSFGGVAVRSSKKISKPKSTYIPKVDPNYKQNVIDKALHEQKSYSDMPLSLVEEINDQRNRTYDLMQEPYARERAKAVDHQYGTDYLKVYDSMLEKYVDIDEYFQLPKPKYKKMERPTIGAQVTPSEGNTMYFNRDMIKTPEDIPNSVVLHEMGHLVDGAAGMNNEFLRKLGDKSKFIPYNQAKTMYPNMTRDMYNNILQGTEIKSYMNQFRNYLNQKGKLNRGNYTGSYKNLKKEIIDAPRESFNNIKAIFNLYRSPKLFNKDFQMIPIVNNNDNNTIV